MTLTVAEAMRELEQLKHGRAIWQETVEHLSKFVDKEVRQAEHGIVAEGCSINPVPQDAVREFINIIEEDEIEPLNTQIAALESLSVEETKDDPTDDDGEKEAPSGKEEKEASSGEGKKGDSQKAVPAKRLRTVPRGPGRKAQGSR